jgi:hypothetical protein
MKSKVIAVFFALGAVFLFVLGQRSVVGQQKPAVAEATAATSPTSTMGPLEETLIDLEKRSWVAWQSRDGKFFDEFLSEDHIEVGLGGLASKAAVVKMVASPICTVKSYSVSNFKCTQIDPNVAVLNYYAEQDTVCNGQPVPSPVWVSSVFAKRGDRWVNVLYQHSQAMKPRQSKT